MTPTRHPQGKTLWSPGKGEALASQTPRVESVTGKKKGIWGRTPGGEGRDPGEAPGSAISKLWTAIKTGGRRMANREQADRPADSNAGNPPPPHPSPTATPLDHLHTSHTLTVHLQTSFPLLCHLQRPVQR